MKARPICKKIAHNSAANYFRAILKQVNVSEETHDKQMNKTRTGLIKFSSLIHNRDKQSYPRLSLIVFQNIAHIFRYITKQCNLQASLLIQGLHVNYRSTKSAGASPATPILSMPLKPTMTLDSKKVTTVPEDLEDIQNWPSQVWNWYEIDFDPNGS